MFKKNHSDCFDPLGLLRKEGWTVIVDSNRPWGQLEPVSRSGEEAFVSSSWFVPSPSWLRVWAFILKKWSFEVWSQFGHCIAPSSTQITPLDTECNQVCRDLSWIRSNLTLWSPISFTCIYMRKSSLCIKIIENLRLNRNIWIFLKNVNILHWKSWAIEWSVLKRRI